MPQRRSVTPSDGLSTVRYEIRGRLARRALEMERLGYEIISLNIGNPGAFGFRTPETMRLAMIENLKASEGYVHQKGIFPAREAVVMQQQERGVSGVSAEEVFIGNGVSAARLRARAGADRASHHATHAGDRRHKPQQPDRRGVSASGARSDCAAR